MTYGEIATCLEVSSKTVDYRIQQALKLLRVELKDYLPELPIELFPLLPYQLFLVQVLKFLQLHY